MSGVVDFSRVFSQQYCNQFLQQSVASSWLPIGLPTGLFMYPKYYEIRHPHTGELKGCLLGSAHALSEVGLQFQMSSRMQKCFDRANKLVGELNLIPLLRATGLSDEKLTEFVMKKGSIDGTLMFAAEKRGMPIDSLELQEDQESLMRTNLQARAQLPVSEQVACDDALVNFLLTGSEECWNRERLCRCMGSKELYEATYPQRNLAMAAKIDRQLKGNQGHPFVVVGVNHLIGQQNIPSLLKGQGWLVDDVKEGS
jgi:uncharacterized protein YbaP (TraB family)